MIRSDWFIDSNVLKMFLGSSILKMFLLAAMLSEGVSWKGAIAKRAEQKVVGTRIGTIIEYINPLSYWGYDIEHGEW